MLGGNVSCPHFCSEIAFLVTKTEIAFLVTQSAKLLWAGPPYSLPSGVSFQHGSLILIIQRAVVEHASTQYDWYSARSDALNRNAFDKSKFNSSSYKLNTEYACSMIPYISKQHKEYVSDDLCSSLVSFTSLDYVLSSLGDCTPGEEGGLDVNGFSSGLMVAVHQSTTLQNCMMYEQTSIHV